MMRNEKTWVFVVLSGLPCAEIEFYDHSKMKEFSANLSALYPSIVTAYDYKKASNEKGEKYE